jgi:hypothetical protein
MQEFATLLAFNVSERFFLGSGALKRLFPIGGSAYGIDNQV